LQGKSIRICHPERNPDEYRDKVEGSIHDTEIYLVIYITHYFQLFMYVFIFHILSKEKS